jgi:hypothetical protein
MLYRGEGDTDKRSVHRRLDSGQYAAGSSGSGKSHLATAFGHPLIEDGYAVFARPADLHVTAGRLNRALHHPKMAQATYSGYARRHWVSENQQYSTE